MDTIDNSFVKTLGEIRGGLSMDELSKGLAAVVAAVRKTGKKGTVTYKLTVRPAGKGTVTAVTVEDDVKVAEPRLEREQSIFFATTENLLSRENPDQAQLPLRVVAEKAPEAVREVAVGS